MNRMQTIKVTAKQMEAIEAAWSICSHGNARKATGIWSKRFRDCVAEVIGYEPEDAFSLDAS